MGWYAADEFIELLLVEGVVINVDEDGFEFSYLISPCMLALYATMPLMSTMFVTHARCVVFRDHRQPGYFILGVDIHLCHDGYDLQSE